MQIRRFLTDAIRDRWVTRGFKLGLGFWLASALVHASTFTVLHGVHAASDAIQTAHFGISLPGPPLKQDPRGWRAQLEAVDQAGKEMNLGPDERQRGESEANHPPTHVAADIQAEIDRQEEIGLRRAVQAEIDRAKAEKQN